MLFQMTRIYGWFHQCLPPLTEKLLWVLLAFVALDTGTGLWVGFACRNVASRRFIEGLTSKAAQFLGVLGVAGGAGVTMGTWLPFQGAITLLVANEGLSNIENARRLQTCGGITFPKPLDDFLTRLGEYLSAGKPKPNDEEVRPHQ